MIFCKLREGQGYLKLKLSGSNIEFVNEIKFLGKHLGNKVSYKKYVTELRKYCQYRINIM